MKRRYVSVALALVLVFAFTVAAFGAGSIGLFVNGKEVKSDVPPLTQNDRILVPIRFVAETLGCSVVWDDERNAVVITRTAGDKYLKGKNDPTLENPSIRSNFIKAADLKAALEDADFSKHPLVVDVRSEKDYNAGHIPGAIWIAEAQNIAEKQNMAKLEESLAEHVAKGGKNEIVLYCYTAHTAGLAAGVLGAEGFNVKNLRFGYSIAWEGTKTADAPIYGPREDINGNPVPYETPAEQ